MANDEHVAMLKKGVDAWNAWRSENPDIRPDLSNADLREANLRGADLSEANLSEASLFEANLSEANLWRANLLGAFLGEANPGGANLRGAHLSWANLMKANLSQADLSEASLTKASLGVANLRGANLSEANLGGADLSVIRRCSMRYGRNCASVTTCQSCSTSAFPRRETLLKPSHCWPAWHVSLWRTSRMPGASRRSLLPLYPTCRPSLYSRYCWRAAPNTVCLSTSNDTLGSWRPTGMLPRSV
jgi:Pentapeptide repeats (8 copies)